MSHKDFLEMCKAFDPSAEVDKARQLENIKTKLNQKECVDMNKNRRMKKPAVAILAAVVGVVTLSAGVLAAVNGNWRHLEVRVLEGEQYVNEITMARKESPDGDVLSGMIDIDRDATSPIIIEVDGVAEVLQDITIVYDLDEALAKLSIDVLQPAYLPEGFAFSHARFLVDPIRNPDHSSAGKNVEIFFNNDDQELRLTVMHYPAEWGMPQWSATYEDLEINNMPARIGGIVLWLQAGDVAHSLGSMDLTHEQLIEIANSLK